MPIKDILRIWRQRSRTKRGTSTSYRDWCALSDEDKVHWRKQFLKKNSDSQPGDILVPHFILNPQYLMKGIHAFGYHPSTSSKKTLRIVTSGYNARLVLVQDFNRPGSCQNAGGMVCVPHAPCVTVKSLLSDPRLRPQARRKNNVRGYAMSYRLFILDETERAPHFDTVFMHSFLTEAANKSWALCREYLDSAVPKPGDNQCWQHTDLRDQMFKMFEFNKMQHKIPTFFPVCRLCANRLCSVTQCVTGPGCDGEFWWDKAPDFGSLDNDSLLLIVVAMINYRSKFWKNGNTVTTRAGKVHFEAKKRKLINKALELHQKEIGEIRGVLAHIGKESLDCEARLKYAEENATDAIKRIKLAEAAFLKCHWYPLLKPLWAPIVFDAKYKISSLVTGENLSLYRDRAAEEGVAISLVFATTCTLLPTVAVNDSSIIAQTFREIARWGKMLHNVVETSSLTTHICSAAQLMQLVAPPAWEMLLALFTNTGLNEEFLSRLLGILVGTTLDQASIETEMERRLFS